MSNKERRLIHFSEEHRRKLSLAKKGKRSNHWNGGRVIDDYGYVKIHCPSHQFCDNHGYVKEHRLVMEKYLGRYLTKDEIVHHINGDRQDNRLDNLELVTRAEHQTIHVKKDMSDRVCSICGNKTRVDVRKNGSSYDHWHIDKESKQYLCVSCYMKVCYHKSDPTIENLIN